jgi:hypothetical protein
MLVSKDHSLELSGNAQESHFNTIYGIPIAQPRPWEGKVCHCITLTDHFRPVCQPVYPRGAKGNSTLKFFCEKEDSLSVVAQIVLPVNHDAFRKPANYSRALAVSRATCEAPPHHLIHCGFVGFAYIALAHPDLQD